LPRSAAPRQLTLLTVTLAPASAVCTAAPEFTPPLKLVIRCWMLGPLNVQKLPIPP
jgi:hypothetical protein